MLKHFKLSAHEVLCTYCIKNILYMLLYNKNIMVHALIGKKSNNGVYDVGYDVSPQSGFISYQSHFFMCPDMHFYPFIVTLVGSCSYLHYRSCSPSFKGNKTQPCRVTKKLQHVTRESWPSHRSSHDKNSQSPNSLRTNIRNDCLTVKAVLLCYYSDTLQSNKPRLNRQLFSSSLTFCTGVGVGHIGQTSPSIFLC